jgi:uncharacterized protein YlaI
MHRGWANRDKHIHGYQCSDCSMRLKSFGSKGDFNKRVKHFARFPPYLVIGMKIPQELTI